MRSFPLPHFSSWRQIDRYTRFLDALFHTIDGNFHQNQKMKPLDPNDFPLSLGAGYFAHEGDFEAYQKLLGPKEREVGLVCATVARSHLTCYFSAVYLSSVRSNGIWRLLG